MPGTKTWNPQLLIFQGQRHRTVLIFSFALIPQLSDEDTQLVVAGDLMRFKDPALHLPSERGLQAIERELISHVGLLTVGDLLVSMGLEGASQVRYKRETRRRRRSHQESQDLILIWSSSLFINLCTSAQVAVLCLFGPKLIRRNYSLFRFCLA